MKARYQLINMLRESLVARAAGILLQVDTKFLLCKRHPGAQTLPRMWTVPSGHIESMETPQAGAIREFYEETNIKLQPASNAIRLLEKRPSASRNGAFWLYHGTADTLLEPTLDFEHTDWGYFDVNSLPDSVSPEVKRWIVKLS